MARLGGNVTGIDAAEKNIKTASFHSKESNLKINYLNMVFLYWFNLNFISGSDSMQYSIGS